jgi:hypothetical protein
MRAFETTGTVVYLPLEGGFWGIEADNGKQWLPLEMPAGLKKAGLRVVLRLRERDDVMTMHQWGSPVRVLSYQILEG